MRVIHINEVSNVAQSLVRGLRVHKCDVVHEHLYDFKDGMSIKTGFFKRALRALRILFKYSGKDTIFHVHYLGNALFFLFSKSKIVVHLHGTDIREPLSFPYKILKRILLTRANYIAYSTPDIAQYITRYQNKSVFMPNPIDLSILEERIEKSAGKVSSIFFFTALSEIKGADIGLRVLKRIKSEYPNIEILTFNFGEYASPADSSWSKQIPKIPRGEVLELIKSSDIILGQLRVGAIGVSELEALALGKPVVAKFTYNQIYETPCPLYNVMNEEESFRSLKALIDDWQPEKQDMWALDRRHWVAQNHSENEISKKLLLIYDRLLQ